MAMHGRRSERGFTLIELLVVIAVLAVIALALGQRGSRRPTLHAAALALQASFAEARADATTSGDAADPTLGTGATIAIAPDPTATSHHSIVRVFHGRPIAEAGTGDAAPLSADRGFPLQRIAADVRLQPVRSAEIATPMTILIAPSGATSIISGYAYDPRAPRTFRSDPGCDDRGVTLTLDDDAGNAETYGFACRGAVLTLDPAAAHAPHG